MNLKFTIIVIALFLFEGAVFAQDTLRMSCLPEAEFTYVVANDTVANFVISDSSSSFQTWDYSQLLNHYQKVPTYDSTSKTAFTGAFPLSNLFTYGPASMYSGLFGSAPVLGQGSNNGYMFWRTDSTGFWVEGFRSDSGPYAGKNVYMQPAELLMPLPGVLFAQYNSFSHWTLPMNSNPSDIDTFYVTQSSKQFTYDAFGAITTPTGTYQVLRLHEYTIKVDSVYARQMGMPVYNMELKRDTIHTYYYMSKAMSYPVCIVYADKNRSVLYTEYFQMKIPASLVGIENSSPSVYVELNPNPAFDYLRLTIDPAQQEQRYTIRICSITGQLIDVIESYQMGDRVDVVKFVTGIYFVSVIDTKGNRVAQFKWMKSE